MCNALITWPYIFRYLSKRQKHNFSKNLEHKETRLFLALGKSASLGKRRVSRHSRVKRNPAFSCTWKVGQFGEKPGFPPFPCEKKPGFFLHLGSRPVWEKAGFLQDKKSDCEKKPGFFLQSGSRPVWEKSLPPTFFVGGRVSRHSRLKETRLLLAVGKSASLGKSRVSRHSRVKRNPAFS